MNLLVTTSLTASFNLQLSNAVATGVTLWHQVVPTALDGGGNVLSLSATNALRLTIGLS